MESKMCITVKLDNLFVVCKQSPKGEWTPERVFAEKSKAKEYADKLLDDLKRKQHKGYEIKIYKIKKH